MRTMLRYICKHFLVIHVYSYFNYLVRSNCVDEDVLSP